MTDAEDLSAARSECLQRILDSKSPRKVIVAGAGTGKTYAFKELLKAVSGRIDVLSIYPQERSEQLVPLATL